MRDADLTYFEGRAEAEIVAASLAEHEKAVRAHYLLAGYYLDKVHGSGSDSAEEHADEAPVSIPGQSN
jgi:hypothetical protein